METLNIASVRGQAKVLGTLICIGGALTFTFWKGRYLFKGFVHRPLIIICSTNSCELSHGKDNWIKGAALILTSHIAWSLWLIMQVMYYICSNDGNISCMKKFLSLFIFFPQIWSIYSQAVVYKVYPARLSLNTLICFFASLQSFFLALFFARNLDLWKLEWNMQLLTILYSGVVISALVYYLQTWCISNKGPVFAAMFSPLLLIVVGLFSAIAFAERLREGSLVGASLIIAGLYCVLWAKRTENLVIAQPDDEKGFDDDKMQEISINETEMNSVTNETK
ncbi:hypothetical protein ACB092_01G140200 [Castanea dentata]